MGIAAPERPQVAGHGHGGMSEAERAKQVRQAEELLFSGPSKEGFAKALFRGEFHAGSLFPYPALPEAERATVDRSVAEVRAFAEVEHRRRRDRPRRTPRIPQSVVDGLNSANSACSGWTAPPAEYGGRGFTQSGYCRIMEVIGGHCAGTAVFVNAHHSIGIRALILFGTAEQKARWLPELTSGRTLAAFALTEPEAGSDASNVQTTATPGPDGQTYILNGTKRWITNGGIAGVLTVMARTPDPRGGESKITAFLVTPDMPGFEVVEKRMDKFSIRGTATGRLAFHDMPVPAANILGPLGKGLRVALTVLDFGRVTFGASCTGVAKLCLQMATEHALKRRQFGRPLADIELVRKKLAFLAASAYAMEATTYETAALIDRGADDYMLETAILKVFATEELWQGMYETMQVYGGSSFFADKPFGRMMRDARLNTVGEGANEVLKAFIALVGMRDVGEGFKATLDSLKNPLKTLPTLWRFGSVRARRAMTRPHVPVVSDAFRPHAQALGSRVRSFAWAVERQLMRHREAILEMQYAQERIADAAIALVTSACTLARIDRALSDGSATELDRSSADFYLRTAGRKFDRCLHELKHNEDAATTFGRGLAAMRAFGSS